MDDIGRSSSAAFTVPWRAAAPRRPQSPGAPAAVGIVDASLKSFGEKSHRIRDGDVGPLPICKRLHAVGLIFENDHGVFTKAEDIVDVDPYVYGLATVPKGPSTPSNFGPGIGCNVNPSGQ